MSYTGIQIPPLFSCLSFNEAVGKFNQIMTDITTQNTPEQWQHVFIETSITFHHESEQSRSRKKKKSENMYKTSNICVFLCTGVSIWRWFFPVVSPEGASIVTKGHTNWAFPQLQGITSRQMRGSKPRPNKLRISVSNPTSESNQKTHLLCFCVDLRGLDHCKEDKSNPTCYIRVQGEERDL